MNDIKAITLAVAAAFPCAAFAAGPEAPEWFERIVIVAASRVEEPLESSPSPVTAIERREIQENVATDLRSLLRYQPGVSVENSPARFGFGNINIRGLDGNRVLMTIDGIRLPEGYRVGSFSNASRNLFGLGLLKQVEILRGPTSAIHGSDALAGVFAVTTVSPAAYLRDGRTSGGELFAQHAQADGSIGGGAVVAGRVGPTQLLVGLESVNGHEMMNKGDVGGTGAARTEPNPQDTHTESQLIKWIVPAGDRWSWTAAGERYARDVTTDVLSLNPQSARTVRLTADDRARRSRGSIEAVGHDAGPWTAVHVTAYAQRSETAQDTDEVRANTTATCLSAAGNVRCEREARFRLVQREAGLIAIGESNLRRFELDHAIVTGAEIARVRFEETRDGRQANLDTGTVTSVVGGEKLPTRDFPVTTSDRFGAFVQDRIETHGATLEWIPALRYDAFRLTPEIDELFLAANGSRPVVSLRESAWSPRFGMMWHAAPLWTFTGQLATGFRAPPASDLNIGLSNLPAGYAVVPNPELKSERSRGIELGARFAGPRLQAWATIFHTRYEDLILSRAALACPGDPACVPGATGTFQSQNVSSARIYGLEAQLEWRFAAQWSAQAAYAHLHGDDLSKDVPLNSIDPPKLVAGVAWRRAWGGLGAHATYVRAPERVDAAAGIKFVPPGWTTLDLDAHWQLAPNIRIDAGLFNVTDRKYWLWSDVRGLTNVGSGFDRYTQPGRNASVGLRVVF